MFISLAPFLITLAMMLGIVAVILGIVALRSIARDPLKTGRAYAITGIALGSVWCAIFIVSAILAIAGVT